MTRTVKLSDWLIANGAVLLFATIFMISPMLKDAAEWNLWLALIGAVMFIGALVNSYAQSVFGERWAGITIVDDITGRVINL